MLNASAYYTWSNKTAVLPGYSLGDNAYFSSNGEVATVTMYNADGYIMMSYDGGNTWNSKLYFPDDWAYFVPISADGQKVFTVGYNNNLLYLSTDGGNTWANKTSSGQYAYALAMSGDGTKIAAVSDNVYISTDDGDTWFTPNYDNPISNFGNVFTIAMSTDGSKVVFSVSGGYIYISTDGGHNFTSVTALGQKSWYSVAMSPDGNKLCADNNADVEDAIYYSYDGGNTWNNHTGHHLYECAIAGDTIIVTQAEDGNFLLSTDAGATWSTEDLNTTGSWFYGVGITPDASKVIAMASFTDLWLGEWVAPPVTPPVEEQVAQDKGNNAYVVQQNIQALQKQAQATTATNPIEQLILNFRSWLLNLLGLKP